MAIGERIRFFRRLRGMTQKQLGAELGFSDATALVRVAQYETGVRKPKAELTRAIAQLLGVSPHALSAPELDSPVGLLHTLFALEDTRGLRVSEQDGELVLRVDASQGEEAQELLELLAVWRQAASMREKGLLSREAYDEWRYRFPDFDPFEAQSGPASGSLADQFHDASR